MVRWKPDNKGTYTSKNTFTFLNSQL
jgi:hypothetical protein